MQKYEKRTPKILTNVNICSDSWEKCHTVQGCLIHNSNEALKRTNEMHEISLKNIYFCVFLQFRLGNVINFKKYSMIFTYTSFHFFTKFYKIICWLQSCNIYLKWKKNVQNKISILVFFCFVLSPFSSWWCTNELIGVT